MITHSLTSICDQPTKPRLVSVFCHCVWSVPKWFIQIVFVESKTKALFVVHTIASVRSSLGWNESAHCVEIVSPLTNHALLRVCVHCSTTKHPSSSLVVVSGGVTTTTGEPVAAQPANRVTSKATARMNIRNFICELQSNQCFRWRRSY